MAYFKIPHTWTEEECFNAIEKLLTEGQTRLEKEKFDNSSQCFITIARIIRSIPELRRKKIINDVQLKKQLRNDKKNGYVKEVID